MWRHAAVHRPSRVHAEHRGRRRGQVRRAAGDGRSPRLCDFELASALFEHSLAESNLPLHASSRPSGRPQPRLLLPVSCPPQRQAKDLAPALPSSNAAAARLRPLSTAARCHPSAVSPSRSAARFSRAVTAATGVGGEGGGGGVRARDELSTLLPLPLRARLRVGAPAPAFRRGPRHADGSGSCSCTADRVAAAAAGSRSHRFHRFHRFHRRRHRRHRLATSPATASSTSAATALGIAAAAPAMACRPAPISARLIGIAPPPSAEPTLTPASSPRSTHPTSVLRPRR